MSIAVASRLPMRVLLIAENTGIGGINRYVMLMAHGLRARDVFVRVAAVWPKPDNWLQASCDRSQIPLTVLASHRAPLQLPRVVFRLRRLMREQQYTHVHSQAYYSGLVARLAKLLAGQPACLVATAHGMVHTSTLTTQFAVWLDRLTYRWNTTTIAVGYHVASQLKDRGFRVRRLTVIPNGIVIAAAVRQAADAAYAKWRSPRGCPIICFVGRLSPEKGCATLIEAARILQERRRTFRMMLVGDGPDRPGLESRVSELGLEKQIAFEGWCVDATAYFQLADVVVIPSDSEGQPFTLLEGMLHGCAIVATRVGGCVELVSDGNSGLLVEPGSPCQLADALDRCLADSALRVRLGKSAQSYVLAHHTVERMVERTLAVYQEVSSEDMAEPQI